jgi:prevent-host-death family protein
MLTIGIRELKQQVSEVLRRVRESGCEVQITYRGKVIALIVPANRAANAQEESRAWEELDRAAEAISARWPAGVSAAQAVSEARR